MFSNFLFKVEEIMEEKSKDELVMMGDKRCGVFSTAQFVSQTKYTDQNCCKFADDYLEAISFV